MPKKAKVKYKSLRSNLVHLPLSLYASLTQQQIRPQSIVLHLEPLTPSSSRATAGYLGWSGLTSSSSLTGGVGGEETLEIDPEVAMGLGWNEGMLVEIGIINNPTKARNVNVTPVSEDDWEILEQHASFLEENLLMQLRAATKGRIYDIWVHRTKIRIRVDETNPKTSENSTVLLHPGTEIYVAPRLRKAESVESPLVNGNGNTKGKEKEKSIKMRLIPGRVASTWVQPVIPEVGELEDVIYCSEGSLRRVRRKLGDEGDGPVYVRMKKAESFSKKATDVEEVKEGEEEEDIGLEGWLTGWYEVPDGCCVIAGIKDDWSESASIRLFSATPPRGRLKGSKLKDPAALEFAPHHPPILLPGLDKVKDEAVAYLRRSTFSPRPLLITGGRGCGKTSVVKAIAAVLEVDRDILSEMIYEDVARIDSEGRLKETKSKIEELLANAQRKKPAVLILEGLDSLLGPEHELTPSTNPTILAELFCRLFTPRNLDGVLVVATAASSTALHPLLNTKHIFGEVIKIAPLTKEGRRDIIATLVDRVSDPNKGGQEGLDFVTLASKTEGYSISDLGDLVNNTLQQSLIRSSKDDTDSTSSLSMIDFEQAQTAFTPISLRGVTLQKSSVKWSDIGGLHEPRRTLRETLEWPTKYAQIFASCPLRLRSGLLLYGYPGCGKTLLASAVAKECGLNFISVKGPEILNKYIGASEKSVRDLFERASAAKPCILFFDEFDSIAPKRGHDSTGVTDRVVNQMLTEMDGAQGLDGVYVLAATSRPDLIDSALLRPGRLDKSILCDMPNEEERLEILKAVSSTLSLSPTIDVASLAANTSGLSGADLQALVYNAHLDVVHSSISHSTPTINGNKEKTESRKYRQIVPPEGEISRADRSEMDTRMDTILSNQSKQSGSSTEKTKTEYTQPMIEQHHLEKSLTTTRPSVSQADRTRLFKIYSTFSGDRDGNMGNGEMGRETGTRSSLM